MPYLVPGYVLLVINLVVRQRFTAFCTSSSGTGTTGTGVRACVMPYPFCVLRGFGLGRISRLTGGSRGRIGRRGSGCILVVGVVVR